MLILIFLPTPIPPPQPLQWGCQGLRMLLKEVTAPPSWQKERDWHWSGVFWAFFSRRNMLGNLSAAPVSPRTSYFCLLCINFPLHFSAVIVLVQWKVPVSRRDIKILKTWRGSGFLGTCSFSPLCWSSLLSTLSVSALAWGFNKDGSATIISTINGRPPQAFAMKGIMGGKAT